MEGHVREHGPLYSSVPFYMFDEGGWVEGSGAPRFFHRFP